MFPVKRRGSPLVWVESLQLERCRSLENSSSAGATVFHMQCSSAYYVFVFSSPPMATVEIQTWQHMRRWDWDSGGKDFLHSRILGTNSYMQVYLASMTLFKFAFFSDVCMQSILCFAVVSMMSWALRCSDIWRNILPGLLVQGFSEWDQHLSGSYADGPHPVIKDLNRTESQGPAW